MTSIDENFYNLDWIQTLTNRCLFVSYEFWQKIGRMNKSERVKSKKREEEGNEVGNLKMILRQSKHR